MRALTLTFSFLLFGLHTYAQLNCETPEGRKVTLNNDGSWSFVDTEVAMDEEKFVNCSQFVTETIDEENEDALIKSKEILTIKGEENKAISVSVIKNQSENRLSMKFEVMGSGDCLDGNSMMYIKLKTGNEIHLENDAEQNCERRFELRLGKVYSNKQVAILLSRTEIEVIGIWTVEGYVEVKLSSQESKSIANTFYCLIN